MMPSTDAQEKDIVFNNLFNEYFIPLCAFCQYKFRFDIDVAKDVVHSAFLKIWESDLSFSSELPSKTYLYKVVTNICLDMLRHEKIKKQHGQYFQKNWTELDLAEENKMTELKEMQNDIENALAELPDQMKRVFELSRYEELKYAEIARQLGISVKTVETQISRALMKLRQKLATYLSVFWIFLFMQGWYNKYFFFL